MIKAAEMYEKESYHGSRTVLLVSDGGQEFSAEDKKTIAELYKRETLTLYWIYMRSTTGLSIEEESDDDSWSKTPEKRLHKFFKSLGIPYRVFDIESVKSFSEAIDTIDKQQDQTLIVEEIIQREIKTEPFFWLAMITMLILVLAHGGARNGKDRAREYIITYSTLVIGGSGNSKFVGCRSGWLIFDAN